MAQQLAMAGQDSEFSIANGSPQTYNIRVGSPLANYNVAGISYPQEVADGVSLSSAPLIISFTNRLGEPSATTTITVFAPSGGSADVCLTSSGYAHAC